MRAGSLMILFLAELLLVCDCGAETAASSSPEATLLTRARWTHEPSSLIRQAVEILDEKLDRDPGDKQAWKKLAEALAIGRANSRHARSASEAWRRAYDLDKSDCHVGALATPSGAQDAEEEWIRQIGQDHLQCAEALYLRALKSGSGSAAKMTLLRESIAQRNSSNALVALGQELVLSGDTREAADRYSAALKSPALFPEDWRPDGWVAVHARLGLAWLNLSKGNMNAARREYRIFLGWFLEPGPWHDLSEAETRWQNKLDARFYKTLVKHSGQLR
jgi:hypothetical protein